jgi:hypothetical protein
MNADRPPLLANLPHRLRERAAKLRGNLRQWSADVREDPGLLWRTPAIRVAFWLGVGLVAFFAARFAANAILPADADAEFKQPTQLATLYVACINPECRESYTTRQPMNFSAWPLTCRKCGRATVYRATLCPTCHHWFATVPGREHNCPFCRTPEPDEPESMPPANPIDPDDAEDGW